MFALLLYWTWTSAPLGGVAGAACADVIAVNSAAVSAGPAYRAQVAAAAIFGIMIDAKTRDCC